METYTLNGDYNGKIPMVRIIVNIHSIVLTLNQSCYWKVIYHNLIINSHSIINQSKLHQIYKLTNINSVKKVLKIYVKKYVFTVFDIGIEIPTLHQHKCTND